MTGRVRSRLNTIGMSVLLSVWCLLGLSAFTSGNGWDEAFGTVLAAGSAVLLLRALNAGLYVTPERLVVRNLGRTYRVPWRDVSAISRGRVDHASGSVSCLVVHLANGAPIPARATAGYRHATVDRELREVARQARAIPAAAHAVDHVPYGDAPAAEVLPHR